ncbi:hypothetical protein PVAP13_1NG092244 [Panicum virgatum]|uniref:Uncharacterized protein n=1 Tax=Panicum virgatum TaxID=38727 RepID=A0A8T0WVN8_PANVG|nr:hypothetical protein PVAP13_1NG092244 [Panicum virgatum]
MTRCDFNTMINNTSFLTNIIKLLSQQTLQHGQEADLDVGCDFLLSTFRSAERSYLGRRNQMVAASWRDGSNNG